MFGHKLIYFVNLSNLESLLARFFIINFDIERITLSAKLCQMNLTLQCIAY